MQEDCLGDLLRADAGVPTSLKPELHATRVGIPLRPLGGDGRSAWIYLSIDSAHEVDLDLDLNLVKASRATVARCSGRR